MPQESFIWVAEQDRTCDPHPGEVLAMDGDSHTLSGIANHLGTELPRRLRDRGYTTRSGDLRGQRADARRSVSSDATVARGEPTGLDADGMALLDPSRSAEGLSPPDHLWAGCPRRSWTQRRRRGSTATSRRSRSSSRTRPR